MQLRGEARRGGVGAGRGDVNASADQGAGNVLVWMLVGFEARG